MEALNEQLVERVDGYIEALFTPADPVLEANLADAKAAGLPAIHVSPNQGRLLYLIAKMSRAAPNSGDRFAGRLQHHVARARPAFLRQSRQPGA